MHGVGDHDGPARSAAPTPPRTPRRRPRRSPPRSRVNTTLPPRTVLWSCGPRAVCSSALRGREGTGTVAAGRRRGGRPGCGVAAIGPVTAVHLLQGRPVGLRGGRGEVTARRHQEVPRDRRRARRRRTTTGPRRGARRRKTTTPRAASHPDFHRRAPEFPPDQPPTEVGARGLSPPVRISTDPGARVSCGLARGGQSATARAVHGRVPPQWAQARAARSRSWPMAARPRLGAVDGRAATKTSAPARRRVPRSRREPRRRPAARTSRSPMARGRGGSWGA